MYDTIPDHVEANPRRRVKAGTDKFSGSTLGAGNDLDPVMAPVGRVGLRMHCRPPFDAACKELLRLRRRPGAVGRARGRAGAGSPAYARCPSPARRPRAGTPDPFLQ